MTIIRGRAGSGRIHELVRRFITDEKSATLITDSMSLDDIVDMINRLQKQGYDISKSEQKNIQTMQFTNCDADYYPMIGSVATDSLYLDIRMPKEMFNHGKSYRGQLEREYGINITIAEKMPVNSGMNGLEISHI